MATASLAQGLKASTTARVVPVKRSSRSAPAGNGKAAAQSEARAALRAANAEVTRAERAADANRKGIERARELVRESNSAAERATAAVEKAQERATADTEKAMLAGKPLAVVNTALDKARAKEKATTEQAAMAQVACANLEGRQRELDGAASYAREKQSRAIDAVRKHEPLVRKVLAEAQKVQDRNIYLRVILRKWLFEKLLDGDDKAAAEQVLRVELPPHPERGSPIDWNATPAARAWDAMRAALAADADAPIEIGLLR
jgi:hypothetical protein